MNIILDSYIEKPIFTIAAITIILIFILIWAYVMVLVIKSNREDREYWERVHYYILPRDKWLKLYHPKQYRKEFKHEKHPR